MHCVCWHPASWFSDSSLNVHSQTAASEVIASYILPHSSGVMLSSTTHSIISRASQVISCLYLFYPMFYVPLQGELSKGQIQPLETLQWLLSLSGVVFNFRQQKKSLGAHLKCRFWVPPSKTRMQAVWMSNCPCRRLWCKDNGDGTLPDPNLELKVTLDCQHSRQGPHSLPSSCPTSFISGWYTGKALICNSLVFPSELFSTMQIVLLVLTSFFFVWLMPTHYLKQPRYYLPRTLLTTPRLHIPCLCLVILASKVHVWQKTLPQSWIF